MSKIAIDIDNTICNTTEFLKPFAEKYDREILHKNGVINDNGVIPRSEEWSEEELLYFKDNYFNKGAINIPIKKDAIIYINKLKELGFKVVFITFRGSLDYDYSDLIIPEWLEKNGVPYDNIVTKTSEKYKYLDGCDYFVDDSIFFCEQAVEKSNSKVIMLRTKWTSNYNNDEIKIADSWEDIYNYIVQDRKGE